VTGQRHHRNIGGRVKNRQVLISKLGIPDVLTLVEEAVPEPETGQVRVRVLESGVSLADLLMRRLYRPLPLSSMPQVTISSALLIRFSENIKTLARLIRTMESECQLKGGDM
jgi:hypothetical protein